MDSSLLIAAGASFVAGLLGYIIVRFWIKPIVRYATTKRKLSHELTRYLAQMSETAGSDKKKAQNRGKPTLRNARKYAEGRGLPIEVRSQKEVEQIKTLVEIKVNN